MRTLKILVELTIDNTNIIQLDSSTATIKELVEVNMNMTGGALPSYLHSLGNYADAEVVGITISETYDTRQQ